MSEIVVTGKAIEHYRRRAHALRAEALREALGRLVRTVRRLFGVAGAVGAATAP